MINAQQLIIHLCIIQVALPGNSLKFFEFLCYLTQMDMWPTDEIYSEIFYFSDTDPFRDSFTIIGYESSGFISLIGSTPIYLIQVLIITIIFKLFKKCSIKFHENEFVLNMAANTSFEIQPSHIVFRLLLESCMELILCCFISIKNGWDE